VRCEQTSHPAATLFGVQHFTGSYARSIPVHSVADVDISNLMILSASEHAALDALQDVRIVHLSGHGSVDSAQMYLHLADDQRLLIEDVEVLLRPSLVLNACQTAVVGSGSRQVGALDDQIDRTRLNQAVRRHLNAVVKFSVPVNLAGGDRCRGLECRLLHSGPPSPWPSVADHLRAKGLRDDNPFRQFARRVADRVGRWMQSAPRDISIKILRRILLRAAILVLRRMFGVHRYRLVEQPEAHAHQHTVDQCRIRGPNADRKTSSPVVFRELAVA
jgi:Uncharacterized protein conserved in bacteria